MSREPLRLYRPSNGTEGEGFMAKFCERCAHDQAFREGRDSKGCYIIACAMCFDVTDPDYPHEWCYDASGRPTCTKFKQRPENDGDDDVAPPTDPTQLVLIADPTEDAAAFTNSPETLSLQEVG